MDAEATTETVEDPLPWRKVLRYVAVWTLVIGGPAVYYGVKWLAFDEPEVLLTCNDGTSQCSSGEGNNRTTAIMFALLWAAPFLLCGIIVLWALRLKAKQRWHPGPPPADQEPAGG